MILNRSRGKGGYTFRELGITVSEEEASRAERELRLLEIEKSIAEDALSKLYEAEASGLITSADREKISRRYESYLKEAEVKMNECRLLIRLRRLEVGRAELLAMLAGKLEALDRRIEELRSMLSERRRRTQPQPKSTVERRTGRTEVEPVKPEESGDDELQKLQEEIRAALEKLEQIELEV